LSKHRITYRRHDPRGTTPAARMGTRLRHRQRGDSLLRNGTRATVLGGLALTAGFGMLAYHTTQAQDAARAAARARAIAYERHQYALQQAALARLHVQQQAAARAAQLAALRTAQANARTRQLAAANAATAAATAAVATSVAARPPATVPATSAAAGSAAASTPASVATPAAAAVPSTPPSPPAVSSGGS
jgi:hypothetical protein